MTTRRRVAAAAAAAASPPAAAPGPTPARPGAASGAGSRIRHLGAEAPEALALIPAAIRPVVRRLYGSGEAPGSP